VLSEVKEMVYEEAIPEQSKTPVKHVKGTLNVLVNISQQVCSSHFHTKTCILHVCEYVTYF